MNQKPYEILIEIFNYFDIKNLIKMQITKKLQNII